MSPNVDVEAHPLSHPAGFSKAPPTLLVNPRKQTISTFVNYLEKNGPVVSWRVNGASTIEGLAWIIPTDWCGDGPWSGKRC